MFADVCRGGTSFAVAPRLARQTQSLGLAARKPPYRFHRRRRRRQLPAAIHFPGKKRRNYERLGTIPDRPVAAAATRPFTVRRLRKRETRAYVTDVLFVLVSRLFNLPLLSNCRNCFGRVAKSSLRNARSPTVTSTRGRPPRGDFNERLTAAVILIEIMLESSIPN